MLRNKYVTCQKNPSTKKTMKCESSSLYVLLIGPELVQKGGIASVQKLILRSADDFLHIHHIPTHKEGSFIQRFQVFLKALASFIWKLQTGRVDLVHLHVSEKGSVLRKLIMLLIAKLSGKPVLMHTHGCEFHLFHDRLPSQARYLVDLALRQTDYLITLSESWKQYYVSQCGLKSSQVIVLFNPVEVPENIPNRSTRNSGILNFIFLGRIGERKGTFELIKAFGAMENRANARLLIAGDGKIDEATALIHSLKLEDSIDLLGWIDEAQRKDLFQKAHVLMLPSHNEGLPMAILEGMANGLPVITTPVGGIPEFITNGKSGYLINPGDIQGLTHAMENLVTDENLRLSMGQHGRERIYPLDVKIYGQKLEQIYRSLLGETFFLDETQNDFSPKLTVEQMIDRKTD